MDIARMESLGFDREAAEKRFQGNMAFFERCITIYFKTNDIALLEQLCSEMNWEQATKCAHSLKGSAGNMAFMRLYEIYSEMTMDLRAGETEKALELLPSAVELEKALREAAGYGA